MKPRKVFGHSESDLIIDTTSMASTASIIPFDTLYADEKLFKPQQLGIRNG